MFLPAMQDPAVGAAEETGREIDVAVRDLVEAGGVAARAILERRRSDLEAGVELLMARETLTAEDFAALRPAGARDVGKALPPKAVA
jgi:cell division protease FtsH